MPSSICEQCEGHVDEVGVCSSCGHHEPLTARERAAFLSPRFDERDTELVGSDPLRFEGYANAVYAARVSTGLHEAAIWGWAEIEHVACALVVLDFRFLGGSMGVAVGEKVARAYDSARFARLPLLAVTASGGARMQEGMLSLAQMAKVVEAWRRHARAGLAQVTLLTSPTTGGVYATFASLGDVVLSEPGAHIGFAGPRVAQLTTGSMPARDTYTPETHLRHGAIDAIVHRRDQVRVLGTALRWLTGRQAEMRPPELRLFTSAQAPPLGRWERVLLARDPRRPKAPEILDALLVDAIELHGDRAGSDDAAVVLRIGALRATGEPVVAVAQDASAGRLRPGSFRKACRGIDIAGRLRLPLVTFIDTPGADVGAEAETGGVARAIADTISAMLDCSSPSLAVVTGEGGSGGAFAMAVADRVIAWQNAIFSVIAPEGAASILFRHAERAPEVAEALRLGAEDLMALKLADAIVPEPEGGAQADRDGALAVLGAEVGRHIGGLRSLSTQGRTARRRRRWRRAGNDFLRDA